MVVKTWIVVGFEVLTAVVMKSTVFWDITPAFMLVSCPSYSSTLKMEAICSSKKLVDFQQTTWRYIAEDSGWRVVITGKTERQEDVTRRNFGKEGMVIHRQAIRDEYP
jgi:hypothetical protein